MSDWTIHHGDCLDVLAGMPCEHFDACVTDPPYGIAFMGKDWDRGVPGVHYWQAVLRVLKPGAHLLAFGGTRTFHRLTCAIEDAGFEIRDCVMWVYGSGFPKSLDVSKAIDRAAGLLKPEGRNFRTDDGRGSVRYTPTIDPRQYSRPQPKTNAARDWLGWGTALKPAWEPIIVARKPLSGTVAANVQQYGTGALNIDGCRIAGSLWKAHRATGLARDKFFTKGPAAEINKTPHRSGRWPANLIHDGSDEVVHLLPSAARFFYCAKPSRTDRDSGCEQFREKTAGERTSRQDGSAGITAYAGATGPARNFHPTVKPTALSRYLIRLVCRPGGIVLDPFAGSGTTGKAALLENCHFVGIEIDAAHRDLSAARVSDAAIHEPRLLQLADAENDA